MMSYFSGGAIAWTCFKKKFRLGSTGCFIGLQVPEAKTFCCDMETESGTISLSGTIVWKKRIDRMKKQFIPFVLFSNFWIDKI